MSRSSDVCFPVASSASRGGCSQAWAKDRRPEPHETTSSRACQNSAAAVDRASGSPPTREARSISLELRSTRYSGGCNCELGGRRCATLTMRSVFIFLIRGYQLAISPLFPASCRYYPTCSAYALEAFKRHGVKRGTRLTVVRILRCHPFRPGGYDPVP